MASTYENDLRLQEIGTGEQSGTWGVTTNTNLELIAEALSYSGTGEPVADAATDTITVANGVADEARCLYLKCTGGGQACTVTLAPSSLSKVWMVENQTSYTLTFKQGSDDAGDKVAVLTGQVKMIATDGAGGTNGAVFDLMQDLAVPDLFVDDDLTLQSDGAVLGFGADKDVTLTHAADTSLALGGAGSTTGLIINNTATDGDPFLAFALSGTQVFTMGVDDGDSDKFKIGTTAIGTNTRLTIDSSGNTTFSGTVTATGTSVFASLDISGDIDVDGTTNLDIVDIDGAVQIDNTVTVGVDDTGYDVKFFGATTGKSWLWDESADSVIVTGSSSQQGTLTVGVDDTGYDVKFFGATSGINWLWDESADGVVQQGTLTVGVDDTGYDVKFFGATSGISWLWDESADGVVQQGTLTVGVDDTGYDVTFFGASASHFMLWDESADELVLAQDSKLSFHDAAGGENIVASADGHLEINAGTTLDITAATVQLNTTTTDINGAVALNGAVTGATNITLSGELDAATGDFSGLVDVAGVLTVSNTTASTSSTSGSLIVGGGVGIADDLFVGDDLDVAGDAVIDGTALVTDVLTTGARVINATSAHDPWLKGINASGAETSYIKLDGTGYFAANVIIGGVGTFADGSASAPSITNTGDLNTGLYFPAADTLGFSTAGVNRMTIDSDGDIIVSGTSSSDETNKSFNLRMLSHDTNEQDVNIIQVETEGSKNQISIGGGTSALNASTAILLRTAAVDTVTGVERMAIDSAGNVIFNSTNTVANFTVESSGDANMLFVDGGENRVGMGTANPTEILSIEDSGNSPTVYVDGNASPAFFKGRANRTGAGQHITEFVGKWNNTSVARIVIAAGSDTTNKDDGLIKFYTAPAGTMAETMTIDSSGNIIIANTGGTLYTTTAGADNFRAGENAGVALTSGSVRNVVIGDDAGTALNSGDDSVLIGADAGESLTSGTQNVAVGSGALKTGVSASNNVAVGREALSATLGSENVAVGVNTLAANQGGSHSVAIGSAALTAQNPSSGNVDFYNTAVGSQAGAAVTIGLRNTAVGANALGYEQEGVYSVAIGYNALEDQRSDASGQNVYNTAVGANAGEQLSTGIQNTLIGGNAGGDGVITGDVNVAVGYDAGKGLTSGAKNTFIGGLAGDGTDDGANNTAVGYESLSANCGSSNTALGYQSGLVLTGAENVLIGNVAGTTFTDADQNVAIGSGALLSDLKGDGSVAVGTSALQSQQFSSVTNTGNTALGHTAGKFLSDGQNNTFVGYQSGLGITTTKTEGNNNTAVGKDAGLLIQGAGHENTCIGYGTGGVLTTGSNNIYVGNDARASSATIVAEHVFGYNQLGQGAGTVTFGNSGAFSSITLGQTSITGSSDSRLKNNITSSTAGLSFVNDLRPVTFEWKTKGDIPETCENYAKDSTESYNDNDKVNHGFVAQEIKAVIDAHSEVGNGHGIWREGPDGIQQVATGALIPMLTKALQELSAKNDALEARIATLEG